VVRRSAELRQRGHRGRYYFGSRVTAVDFYSAAFMAMFKPLPQAVCAMDAKIRAALETLDSETAAALDPVLL
jgi:hypothetical protein